METSQWHERFVQQARWTNVLRRHLYEAVGIRSGRQVLEVGCGTGAVLSDFFEDRVHVRGVDINLEYLAYAAQNAPPGSLAAADGYILPFKTGVFDACLCHYLLLWTARPIDILREMRRVTRSGGVVLGLAEPDYGGRIDYPAELQRLGELQAESLTSQGADPNLGRQLRACLVQAGLSDVSGGVLGGQWDEAPQSRDWEIEWRVMKEDLAQRLSAEEWQRLRAIDRAAWQSRQRVLYVPTFYAFGYVKDRPVSPFRTGRFGESEEETISPRTTSSSS